MKLLGKKKHQIHVRERFLRTKENFSLNKEMSQVFYYSEDWYRLKIFIKSIYKEECCFCRNKNNLQCDHIVPISIDPSKCLDYENIQILCKDCNSEKSNKASLRYDTILKKNEKIIVPLEIVELKYFWPLYFPLTGRTPSLKRIKDIAKNSTRNIETYYIYQKGKTVSFKKKRKIDPIKKLSISDQVKIIEKIFKK